MSRRAAHLVELPPIAPPSASAVAGLPRQSAGSLRRAYVRACSSRALRTNRAGVRAARGGTDVIRPWPHPGLCSRGSSSARERSVHRRQRRGADSTGSPDHRALRRADLRVSIAGGASDRTDRRRRTGISPGRCSSPFGHRTRRTCLPAMRGMRVPAPPSSRTCGLRAVDRGRYGRRAAAIAAAAFLRYPANRSGLASPSRTSRRRL